jgi:transposase InsO family protein
LEQHGIRQIVARPRRPQTLGKIERFWGNLWREFLETAVFADLAEARARIGLFIDLQFSTSPSGVDGLVPADRFFGAATEVARAGNEWPPASLELVGTAGRDTFYVTGQLDGQSFSVPPRDRESS